MANPTRTPKPELLTQGRSDFDAWLSGGGYTEVEVAKALGVTKGSVNNWRGGHSSPDWVYRVAIEKLSNGRVKAKSWETASELQIIESVQPLAPKDHASEAFVPPVSPVAA